MFDIGWGELLVIGIVALIVIGPKELPGMLRTLGQGMTKIRRMASEFQGQFNEAMREAEMSDIKKSVDEMSAAARGIQYYDPMNPDGLEPAKEAKPPEPPPETPAVDTPVQTAAAPAVPEPDAGPAEPPKEDVKPGEGRAS